jgi:murein DD-endopeptidase MepM/ murein hydrolase activator NlpD
MNCREVNDLLVPFLDREILPSEYGLIQTHLAGCPACQKKLSALSATRSRLIRAMPLLADQVAPSPQTWERLQMRLAEGTRPSPAWPKRLAPITDPKYPHYRFSRKSGVTSAVLVVLIMAISVLAFVPSVRAQVGKIIAGVVPTPLVSLPGACPRITGGWVGSGVFIWPTALHVISGSDYNIQLHPAIDLAATLDSPVVAIDTGVVIFAGHNDYDYGYGNMVIIDHRNGWQSLYAHLDAVKIVCGENVKQGQVIGLAGETGNSSTVHLHFELWQITPGGQVNEVNPHLYLPMP